MNYLDYTICVPLLWGAYKGFSKGFLFEIALLIALVLGVYGALKCSSMASGYLQHHFHLSAALLPFVSFLAVFAAIVVTILLIAKLLELLIKPTPLGIINRIAGALLGIVKWAFIMSAFFYMLTPIDDQFHLLNEKTKEQSILYKPLTTFASYVMPKVRSEVNSRIPQKIPSLP